MANYTGHLVSPLLSDNKRDVIVSSLMKSSLAELSSTRSYDGSKSLKILAGGSKDIYVVCAAGSRTITCQVWPNSNTDKCGMILFDPDSMGEELDSDWSASEDAWEELSIAFTAAAAKIYIIRLINSAANNVSDAEAWFDAIAVE